MTIEKAKLVFTTFSLFAFFLSSNLCFAGEAPKQEIHCSGRVMDYQANEVVGADVYLFEIHWAYAEGRKLWKPLGRTVTDSNGAFSINVTAADSGNIWALASKPGLALGYESVLHESTDIEFMIKLAKPDILAGLVLDENKKPIAGATLQLCLSSSDIANGRDITIPSLEKLFGTTTDAKGRFSFTHVPEGASADFFVKIPGKAAVWTFWENDNLVGSQFPAGCEDIEIVLRPEARIEGRVVDVDTGEGVSGVTLLARANKRIANYYNPYKTVSSQEGRFALSGLPADDYSVQVVAPYEDTPEWVGKDVKVTIEQGQNKQDVEVPVGKGAMIEVSVKEPKTEKPLEGAWVNVRQKADFGRHTCYYKTVYSDKSGVTSFRVPPGECSISVGGDLYVYFEDPEPINAVTGSTICRDIELVKKSSVSGIITVQQGKPVANVLVASKPVCEQSVRTDAQGCFQVRWYLHPRYTSEKWFLLAQDTVSNRACLMEINEDTKSQNMKLEPAYSLSGRVMDPNGRGIPLASIGLRGSMPGWLTNVGNNVFTDKQGRYEIKALPAQIRDFKYSLEISAGGYGPIKEENIRTQGDPNMPVEIAPITLQPTDQSINGIVVDANDRPVAGIEIFISGPRGNSTSGQPEHQTVTDEQGRFLVERVCKGPLRIQAGYGSRAGGSGSLEARGGDRDVKVILGRRLVHDRYKSLEGSVLPSLSDLEIDPDVIDMDGKAVLVCFWDMHQRPSRNCIAQLSNKAQELKTKDIAVIAIQATKIDKKTLEDWTGENEISLPIGMIKNDEEKTRFNWGVKSLPWLILTDKQHVITAEGFAVSELDDKIQSAQE